MRQIVKLFFFCAVFLTCSLPTAATEYVGGFPYHTRLSPAERSRMEAIGAIEGGLAPFIWGIVGSCIILFLRPRRRRYWITFFLFAGLGMWFLLFWPATKGDTSSPLLIGRLAGVCFSCIFTCAAMSLSFLSLPTNSVNARGFQVVTEK